VARDRPRVSPPTTEVHDHHDRAATAGPALITWASYPATGPYGRRVEWTTPSRLQREWVLCAIAAAASRFIPVPLADDLVKERAVRTAVSRTWRAHGRPPAPRAIDILVGDGGGFVAGLVRSGVRLPLTLALYPWRKVVRVVTAVHGVSGDLVRVLLLARSVDRCLAAGRLDSTDPVLLEQEAHLVREAHDEAMAGVDLKVLEHAVGFGWTQVRGLSGQAARFARRTFDRSDHAPGQDPEVTPDETVERGAEQVQAALRRPEVVGLLASLDARFDAALAARDPGRR
jgi:hypothetical protein